MIAVDTRWTGQHGIGRYATEVLRRLTTEWEPIPSGGAPSSPTDFLLKDIRPKGQTPNGIYSPGYNGFLRNVPQVVTLHDLIHLQSPGSAKYWPYYNLFLRPLIRRNRIVITNSETSRAHIVDWLNDSRVEVVNAGMGSSSHFTRIGDSHRRERPYFVYVGNLKSHKNVATIIAAMQRMPDADLLLVTSDASTARQLAADRAVTSQIHIAGAVDDAELAQLYRGAVATLQPSTLEGFGLPALEAALCGSPVIYSAICQSVSEICADGGIAVSNATDPEEWAAVMRSALDGTRLPDVVIDTDSYSWNLVASKVSDVLERAF